jgi:glucose-1-phosphate thymidylyltransferase
MQAVILAAGAGKRLWPYSEDIPKPMIEVGNKPVLEYIIEALVQNNIRDIIIVVGYKKEKIMSCFQDGKRLGASIRYVVQSQQLGTAHALYQARNLVKDDFIVLPGDNILLPDAIESVKNTKGYAVLLTETDDPSKYGVAYLSGKILKTIVEKPTTPAYNIISTSIFKFDAQIFEEIEICISNNKYDLIDLIRECSMRKEIYAITLSNVWKDIVYPWSLIDVNSFVLHGIKERVAGTIDNRAVIRGKVIIGEDTIIHPGTYITGPVVIGTGCEIGPSVVIFPSTSIGNNVKISPFSIVENSIIMDNTFIGPNSTICSSVFGEGTIVESMFHARTGIATIELEGELHRVKHIGAIIGSRCSIQHDVFAKPGTIIGNDCKLSATARVSGVIPSRTMVM